MLSLVPSDLGDLEVASPTLSKDSLPLILQMLAVSGGICVLLTSRPRVPCAGKGVNLMLRCPNCATLLWMHPQEADRSQLLRINVAWYGLEGPQAT